MKFSIDRSDLLRSLGHVHTIVERRNTIPILANVLLKAEDGVLFLNTTDMDLEVTERARHLRVLICELPRR